MEFRAISIDRRDLALGKNLQNIAVGRVSDAAGFRFEQLHQLAARAGMVKRGGGRHRDDVGNSARGGDQLIADIHLELGELVDEQHIDLVGGDLAARCNPARTDEAHEQVASRRARLSRLDGNCMSARKQLFFPLADQIVGHDQGNAEQARRLGGQRPHHHDRLYGLAEADLVGEQPSACGRGCHAVDAIDLVRVGERADAKRAQQRLVSIVATRLGVKAEQETKKAAHDTLPPSIDPIRMAA
jgi:hypothetical protein